MAALSKPRAKLALLAEFEDRSNGAVIRRAVKLLDAPPAEPAKWELEGWDSRDE